MEYLLEAVAWITDAQHWQGEAGIPNRIAEHLAITALSVLLAAAVALPLGAFVGHTGRGRVAIVAVAGALRALPTLGLVTLAALAIGSGLFAPVVALAVLAIPPLLTGVSAGIDAVGRAVPDAARAMGYSPLGVLFRVELPLALPLVLAGVRAAVLQVIATATVAAYVPLGGLGRYLFDALPVRDYAQMNAGALLVICVAALVDALLVVGCRAVTPRGVRANASRAALS